MSINLISQLVRFSRGSSLLPDSPRTEELAAAQNDKLSSPPPVFLELRFDFGSGDDGVEKGDDAGFVYAQESGREELEFGEGEGVDQGAVEDSAREVCHRTWR